MAGPALARIAEPDLLQESFEMRAPGFSVSREAGMAIITIARKLDETTPAAGGDESIKPALG
jgi:hypothetical protein